MIEKQSRSGLSVQQYCREQRISQASFYLWKGRLNDSADQKARFAEVRVCEPQQEAPSLPPIELVVSGRYALKLARGFDEQNLVRILGLLKELV